MLVQKRLLLLFSLFTLPALMFAQVTTSSITGTVKNKNGETLEGASVTVTHIPTGAVSKTLARKNGRYDIVNLTPGGPYTVDVSFVGYTNFTADNITLTLGDNTRIDADLTATSTILSTVVVASNSGNNSKRKTGASTNIGKEQIAALPTLSRSLQDFTRLTPQANGNSFGGMNNRFNNITIDGAINNDAFGIPANGTPGGQASTTPISLDAIQEIQVVLAPYDITYGNFTGGGVNAVTRSGTNNFEGSVYYFVRNENITGKDPVSRQKTADFNDQQYGVRLGGPIVKNKLFFFVNGEMERKIAPTIFNAGDDGAAISSKDAHDLADTVLRKYQYDLGAANGFDAKTQSDKIFGRLDWNISNKHHLTIRHNYIKAFDDNITRSSTLFRFGNNTYRFNNKQNITVLELRSRLSKSLSNDLIIGNQSIRDFRTTLGSLFPSVEIASGASTIQFGSERSSVANQLDQDIFEVTDNLKIFKGKNTITLGTHNEFFKFRNLFLNNFNGRWRFASLADFYNNNPRQFDVTFSANKAGNLKPDVNFKAAQLGFYLQDEIQFTPQFRLTAGVRVDVPLLKDKPAYNPEVDSTFGGLYNTQNTPNGQLLFSPRVGFNYDIEGDKRLIFRGGAGIFSGRIPFVWLANQFGNSGELFNTVSQRDDTRTAGNEVNNGNGFVPDVNAQSTIGSAARSYEADLIDKKFKLPQVLRINAATDVKLPGDINLTIEAILSKTINNVLYQDINLTAPAGVVDSTYNNGFDKRIAYASSDSGRRKNPNITNGILITNTNKGYSLNVGFTLNRTWKNVFAQVAYNYNNAADVNSGASSTALSNWEFVQVVGDPNNPPLATSNYELKHRVTAVLSVNFNYLKHLRTTVSLFYAGNSGQPFTYLVNGDLNSDGRLGNDLIYVPNNPNEIKFVDFLNRDNTVRYTAAQQSQFFEAMINNDPYLRRRRGQYTERNGRSTKWENVIDGRIAEDLYFKTGTKMHTLQLTFDIFNLGNLLNKKWGRQYSVTNQSYNLLTTVNRTTGPLQSRGKGYNFDPSQAPWSLNFASRWQGQIGVRYTFN